MARSAGNERVLLAVLLGVYLALFVRTLGHDFVWDDVHEIQDNAAFDGSLAGGLGSTQTERTDADLTQLQDVELSYDSYRPLLFVSYWIDIHLWGRSARALHAINVLLGALAILAAWLVARRALDGSLGPVAVFALHPAQIEAVAYISGRGDLLAGLFALVATYAALRAFVSPRWTVVAVLAFAASVLCKEAYVGLPIAIAGLAWARGMLRTRWWIPATLLGVVLAYLALRSVIVTSTSRGALADALLALPGVWLEYARLTVLPFDLSTERMHASAFVVPGWIAAGLAAAGLVVRVRRNRAPIAPASRTAIAGFLWFATLLGPSTVAIVGSGVVADRYLYAPLFGLAWAITAIAHQVVEARPRLGRPLAGAAALWVVLLVVIDWLQVPVWRDNRSLYTHAVTMTPDSSSAHYRVAYLDAQVGRWDDAIPRLERAIELDARNLRALNNLGVGYLRTARPADAEAVLARAVEVNPAHFRSWFNLGAARIAQGKRASGCAAITRALEINPRYEAASKELQRSCPGPLPVRETSDLR
jgi:hypothetical protein